jgi:hypothetical protein
VAAALAHVPVPVAPVPAPVAVDKLESNVSRRWTQNLIAPKSGDFGVQVNN